MLCAGFASSCAMICIVSQIVGQFDFKVGPVLSLGNLVVVSAEGNYKHRLCSGGSKLAGYRNPYNFGPPKVRQEFMAEDFRDEDVSARG